MSNELIILESSYNKNIIEIITPKKEFESKEALKAEIKNINIKSSTELIINNKTIMIQNFIYPKIKRYSSNFKSNWDDLSLGELLEYEYKEDENID